MGRFVFIGKGWRSRYKDREGDAAYSHNHDYHIYWEKEETIPEGFNAFSFPRDDLLYLRTYLNERGFDSPFIRSVLHESLDNLWENRGYEAYFLLSVTCYFLFGFNAGPLDVEYIEDGWKEGSYINGITGDFDLNGDPNEEVIDLIPYVAEMTSLLREWIEEL